jgi:hypothetical protein
MCVSKCTTMVSCGGEVRGHEILVIRLAVRFHDIEKIQDCAGTLLQTRILGLFVVNMIRTTGVEPTEYPKLRLVENFPTILGYCATFA